MRQTCNKTNLTNHSCSGIQCFRGQGTNFIWRCDRRFFLISNFICLHSIFLFQKLQDFICGMIRYLKLGILLLGVGCFLSCDFCHFFCFSFKRSRSFCFVFKRGCFFGCGFCCLLCFNFSCFVSYSFCYLFCLVFCCCFGYGVCCLFCFNLCCFGRIKGYRLLRFRFCFVCCIADRLLLCFILFRCFLLCSCTFLLNRSFF